MSASQCESGGESGWTLYLDQSSVPNYQCQSFVDKDNRGRAAKTEDYDDYEEDLSMVSDASSGPRHYNDDTEEHCFCENEALSFAPSSSQFSKKSKNKDKIKQDGAGKQRNSHLDDTASSPVFGFSKGKSAFQKNPRGFSKSSLAGKPTSREQGGFQRKKGEKESDKSGKQPEHIRK